MQIKATALNNKYEKIKNISKYINVLILFWVSINSVIFLYLIFFLHVVIF